MIQTISLLDATTMLVKVEKENDLSVLYDHLKGQDKRQKVNALLNFADKHRIIDTGFKFNRAECYDRENFY